MAQSLSWIDASELEAQLRRIGVVARANEKPTAKHSLPDMAAQAAAVDAAALPVESPPTVAESLPPFDDEPDPNDETRPPLGDVEPDYDEITRPPAGSDSTQPLKQADLERAVTVSGVHPVRVPPSPADDVSESESDPAARAPVAVRATGTQPRWPAQRLAPTLDQQAKAVPATVAEDGEGVEGDEPAGDDHDADVAGPGPDDETPAPRGFRPPGMTAASIDEEPFEELAGPDGEPPAPGPRSFGGPIPVARPSVEDGDSSILPAPTGTDLHEAVSVDGPDAAAKSGVAGSAWSRFPSGKALARIQLRTRSHMVSESDEAAPMVASSSGAAHGFERSSAQSLARPDRSDSRGESPGARAHTEELLAVGLSLQERVAALAELLCDKTNSRGTFIADADGFALAQVNCSDHEVALSAALRAALRPIRQLIDDPEDRSIAMELSDHEFLHVVWVDTDRGNLAVGLYCSRLLGADLNPAVRRMLLRVLATDTREAHVDAADEAE